MESNQIKSYPKNPKVSVCIDLAEDEYHRLTFSLMNNSCSINFKVHMFVGEPTVATMAYYQHELLKIKYMGVDHITFAASRYSGFRVEPEKKTII